MDFTNDGTSGKGLDHQRSYFEYIDATVSVKSALVAEGCIGAQAVTASRTTNTGGIEACTFEKYRSGLLGDTAVKAAKDSGNAHGALIAVANHQVGCIQGAFHTVQSRKLGARLAGAHNYGITIDMCTVEAVQRLA